MKRVIKFFMPQEDVFFDLLKKQSEMVCKTGSLFGKLLKDYNKLTLIQRKKKVKEIVKIEQEADHLTHEIVALLHKSFITPLDREDIHGITHLMDDLVDLMDEIATKLLQYEIKAIPENFFDLCAVSLQALMEVNKAVSLMKKPNLINPHLRKIHDLEDEGDKIFYDAITNLFKKEKNAVKIIKFKDLYERAESLTDKSQDVAILIEGIVVKHA